MNDYILAAEWEHQSEVLLALPHPGTDWSYMLPQVHECYAQLLRALLQSDAKPCLLTHAAQYARQVLPGDCLEGTVIVEAEYNDTWIRDYGPLTLRNAEGKIRLADFGFNGWGLKFAADKDNLVTNKLFGPDSSGFPLNGYRNYLGYVLEGGSIETDGRGTILTTSRCLCSPNRNGGLSKAEIERVFSKLLGISHFLWLDHGGLTGDDTDSHIDTLARICPDETILYVGCSDPKDEHYEPLHAMKEQLMSLRTPQDNQYNLIELPLPRAIFDEDDGHRLPATYANYLVTNKAILMPVYRQPDMDELACKIVRVAYPDHEVIPVDCTALIRQHGSLHCATMQINR